MPSIEEDRTYEFARNAVQQPTSERLLRGGRGLVNLDSK